MRVIGHVLLRLHCCIYIIGPVLSSLLRTDVFNSDIFRLELLKGLSSLCYWSLGVEDSRTQGDRMRAACHLTNLVYYLDNLRLERGQCHVQRETFVYSFPVIIIVINC